MTLSDNPFWLAQVARRVFFLALLDANADVLFPLIHLVKHELDLAIGELEEIWRKQA